MLTSYITAAAIMTAPVGWFAARFGRKRFFVACLIGFTITSMMCGAAQSLPQIVLFRVLQGCFGAALVPLSQATMLDIYPPEKRGAAMAIWGVGVMIGPILGPTLGGYLTELYNWRYVFYINLPFGILATLGLLVFMPQGARAEHAAVRLDRLLGAVDGHRRACSSCSIAARIRTGSAPMRSSPSACWAASASICSWCTCSPRHGRSSARAYSVIGISPPGWR